MKRRLFAQLPGVLILGSLAAWPAMAADEAPNALIERLTKEALSTIAADKGVQAGDVGRIITLMDEKIMPYLNFQRMTSAAVGPAWRQALLVRTYAGAMSQARNLSFEVKPLRASPDDKEVIVRTVILGRGDPVQLDYRLEKTPGDGAGWKIYNLNVLGVWLVDTYRSQFAQEINAKGVDRPTRRLPSPPKVSRAAIASDSQSVQRHRLFA